MDWAPVRIEVHLPATADERAMIASLTQEAEASNLRSSGLIVGDVHVQAFDAGEHVRSYAMSFTAAAPLDVDHVALILVRRLRWRLAAEGILPVSIASVAPGRAQGPSPTGPAPVARSGPA